MRRSEYDPVRVGDEDQAMQGHRYRLRMESKIIILSLISLTIVYYSGQILGVISQSFASTEGKGLQNTVQQQQNSSILSPRTLNNQHDSADQTKNIDSSEIQIQEQSQSDNQNKKNDIQNLKQQQEQVLNPQIQSQQEQAQNPQIIRQRFKKTINDLIGDTETSSHQKMWNFPSPKYYINISSVANVKELPFCVVTLNARNNTLPQIQHSLSLQNYTNIYHVYSAPEELNLESIYVKEHATSSVLLLQDIAKNQCPQKSVILLASRPLKDSVLTGLNQIYQRKNVWMTYHSDKQKPLHGITSFFPSVLNHAIKNNLKDSGVRSLLTTMARLGAMHAQQIGYHRIYAQLVDQVVLECFQKKLTEGGQILRIDKIFTLSEDIHQGYYKYEKNLKKLLENKARFYISKNGITTNQMLMAIEYLEIKNLPFNHSLNDREKQYYIQKYDIYGQDIGDKQLPICIVTPSYNNKPHSRFRKVLDTVKQQNYSNYHLVFIDDASKDDTFNASKKYADQIKLSDKISFVQNSKQRFATYNIYNGVKNYCKSEDIVILVDGDDELIGRQVLKFINSLYLRNDYWLIYTNYFKSDYSYGGSKPLDEEFFELQYRQKWHFISPLRTFYAKLYLKIDQKDHKFKNGSYLDTLYDLAMQYPLLEMTGMEHAQYFPELNYFYNTQYGNNDDSNQKKINHRKMTHLQIVNRPQYKKIDKLFV